MEREAREIPTIARFLQDAAADAHGGRASVRRKLAAGRRRRGKARPDRADPRRPARAHRSGGEAVRHRSRRLPIVDAAYSEASAEKAVALVREGKAEALMKGSLHTDELMAAVVKRDTGLRTARRISHCFVMDVPSYRRDADRHRRRGQHRADDGGQGPHHPERDRPRARAALPRGARGDPVGDGNGQSQGAVDGRGRRACARWPIAARSPARILDGPLALDNAISLESVKIKKIDSPVAGRANVLVVPDLEAGNMLAKSLSFLAGADAAGIVLGARVPIILTSRADSVMTRLASCGDCGAGRAGAARSGQQGGRLMPWPTPSPS